MSGTVKRVRAIKDVIASMGFEIVGWRQRTHIVLELRHENLAGTRTLSLSASPKNSDHQIAQVRKDLVKILHRD